MFPSFFSWINRLPPLPLIRPAVPTAPRYDGVLLAADASIVFTAISSVFCTIALTDSTISPPLTNVVMLCMGAFFIGQSVYFYSKASRFYQDLQATYHEKKTVYLTGYYLAFTSSWAASVATMCHGLRLVMRSQKKALTRKVTLEARLSCLFFVISGFLAFKIVGRLRFDKASYQTAALLDP